MHPPTGRDGGMAGMDKQAVVALHRPGADPPSAGARCVVIPSRTRSVEGRSGTNLLSGWQSGGSSSSSATCTTEQRPLVEEPVKLNLLPILLPETAHQIHNAQNGLTHARRHDASLGKLLTHVASNGGLPGLPPVNCPCARIKAVE